MAIPESAPGGCRLDASDAESELLQLQRLHLLGEFAAAVVHDLNNVLTEVTCIGALLRSRLGDDHAALLYLDMLDAAAAAGAGASRQLLDLARTQEGVEFADLNGIACRVAALVACTTPAGVDVVLELQEPLPSVRADPALLHQALTNLVLNAAAAMPSGGRVVLRTRLSAGIADRGEDDERRIDAVRCVAVDVVDTGTGIAPDVLSQMFEPFFTTRGGRGGTGLGLTSVRRIAERCGGSVEVVSAPGAGSTFTLLIPAEPH